MPEWKADLLDWGGLESCSEEIASRAPIQEIDTIRNLNFLGILNQAIEPANGYSFSWDVLKEGLATVIGREAADILVLGVRYEGRAWTFEPDLVSYQFGLILSEDVIKLHEQAQSVTSTTFTARLKEIDFSRIYPVYSHRLSAEFLPEAVAALDGLKDNLRDAKERGCGVLYLLD